MVKDYEERLADVDKVINEVREMISLTKDRGEIGELEALQLLLRITKELHSIHNVADIVTKALDTALAFVDGDRAFMMLTQDDDMPRFKLGRDKKGKYLGRKDFSPSKGVIERVLKEQRVLIIPDAQSDEVFSKRKSVQEMSLRTVICAPLTIKKNLIGLFYIDSNQNVLGHQTRAHYNVLASLADQTAAAIKNAQKFETYI